MSARIGWKALTAAEYQNDGYIFLATPNIKERDINFDNVNYISEYRYDESPDLKLRRGDVLLAKDGNTLGIVNIVRNLPRPATVNGSIAVLRPFGVDPRFLCYALASSPLQGRIQAVKDGMGVPHLFQRDIKRLSVPAPPLEEQRRIADFLDTETARIDKIISLRQRGKEVLEERAQILLDGAVVGDPAALRTLGVGTYSEGLKPIKLARVCQITPGFSFPSQRFSLDPEDNRLLRGVNVGVDRINWNDSVYWPRAESRQLQRFFLRAGDLVVGMDRPWISSGFRVAIVSDSDLPALLLQRVARVRPNRATDIRYVKYALSSTHFRNTVEGELTGVSVPHLSGEQIGEHKVLLPPLSVQKVIASKLAAVIGAIQAAAESMETQCRLLEERRRAVVTAAVTGELDVATAHGMSSV